MTAMRCMGWLAGTLLLLSAFPAYATETVTCSATDRSDASVDMNLGSGLPAEIPSWVRVMSDGASWSSLGMDTEMTPVNIYQAFDDGRLIAIDLADEPVSEVVIEIRILRADEGERSVRTGYLRVLGKYLHPILCDFGEPE